MDGRPYIRPVHYYETDQMGIVHHSNYIRWFEEARLDFMARQGVSYPELEEQGILMPVVDVHCTYVNSAHYGDQIQIFLTMTQYTGVRMGFSYEVRFADGSLCASGTSTHCFLDRSRRPVSLKRKEPQLHALLCGLVCDADKP